MGQKESAKLTSNMNFAYLQNIYNAFSDVFIVWNNYTLSKKKCHGRTVYLWLTADLHSPLLFHTYRHSVKPLAANCFHITEQPGDLGGFPRPPTLGHGACTFANAYHQSLAASLCKHRPRANMKAAICYITGSKVPLCHCLGPS